MTTNPFLQNLKTSFVDPFKKAIGPLPTVNSSPAPAVKPTTLNTNNGMVTPLPNMSVAPAPASSPTPNMSMAPLGPVQPTVPKVKAPSDPNILAQQKALNAKGAGLVEDGILGPLTRAAIAKYSAPTQTSTGQTINPATGGVTVTPPPAPAPTQPAIPTISANEQRIIDAEKSYMEAGQMTPEEEAAQAELDRLQASFRTGYQGINDKTIPMEFITGQLSSLENRALNLAEPLESKLARLQAKRMSSLEASKFALERADAKLKSEQDKTSTEPFTLGEGQTRYDAAGNVIARGATGSTALDKDQDPNRILSVAEAKDLGVPYGTTAGEAYGNRIGDEKNDRANQYSTEKADRAITLVDEALGKVNKWTTGFGALLSVIPETDAKDFSALIESIKANIGFNELSAMRAASPTGGALGQVAVQELNFLQSVLGSLDTKQSPATVKANLEKIKTHFNNWKATLGASAGGAGVIETTIGPINTNW